jgi:hypothetical protein
MFWKEITRNYSEINWADVFGKKLSEIING